LIETKGYKDRSMLTREVGEDEEGGVGLGGGEGEVHTEGRRAGDSNRTTLNEFIHD
jgi:hypothetical protein